MSASDALPNAIAGLSRSQPDYLNSHHKEAAQVVARLFERSQLRAHTTMHYGPGIGTARGTAFTTGDLADTAADARARLNSLVSGLPPECAGVVVDVCCYEKGLQDIERERAWPRRSAKLVLRMGLEAIANRLGFTPLAAGPVKAKHRTWRGAGAVPREAG